jgi:anti-sigma factor RsiW
MSQETLANLIRLAADDELSDQQQAELDALRSDHPEVAESVAFQRSLRVAVGRSMGGPGMTAPAGLEGRIRKALAAEEHRQAMEANGPFNFIRTLGRRQVPNSIAAGFLLLLGAAVVMSLLGLPRGNQGFGPAMNGLQVESGLEFPAIEHVKCTSNRTYAEQKLTLHQLDEVERHFTDELKWDVAVPDLTSIGYTFFDAGPCTLNGRSVESVHLRYQNEESIVSVWVERAPRSDLTHVAGFVDGHAYMVMPSVNPGAVESGPSYFAWRRGDFVYRLVPSSVDDARAIAMTVGMPDVTLEEFK